MNALPSLEFVKCKHFMKTHSFDCCHLPHANIIIVLAFDVCGILKINDVFFHYDYAAENACDFSRWNRMVFVQYSRNVRLKSSAEHNFFDLNNRKVSSILTLCALFPFEIILNLHIFWGDKWVLYQSSYVHVLSKSVYTLYQVECIHWNGVTIIR